MTLENPGLSRRKLLRTTAIGVPAAGLLAFGSTLVTAPSANAATVKVVDGLWGKETSAGVQRLMNLLYPEAGLVVDGVISAQPLHMKQPGLATFGWEWVPNDQATGSLTMYWMHKWLGDMRHGVDNSTEKYRITHSFILALQKHYGIPADGVLDDSSKTIKGLQNEINQWVG